MYRDKADSLVLHGDEAAQAPKHHTPRLISYGYPMKLISCRSLSAFTGQATPILQKTGAAAIYAIAQSGSCNKILFDRAALFQRYAASRMCMTLNITGEHSPVHQSHVLLNVNVHVQANMPCSV